MVWVPLDLGVEEVAGGVLGPQELVGVIEVFPGLRDRPLRVVVELLVLVTGDDMPGLKSLDLVDRVPPWAEASDDNTFPELQVSGVVNDIPDDEAKIRDVLSFVSAWPTSTITRSCPSILDDGIDHVRVG